jgi:hypothetical protein
MPSTELLVDCFGRVHDLVHQVVDGAKPDQLTFRVDPDANTIAWLVWHLTRVQDDHIADAASLGQVWTLDGWAGRFELPLDETDTGYGHGSADVAAVRASAELLLAYHDAVYQRSIDYVRTLGEADLARIVDERWDPPVTLAVRLVSVIGDCLQHAGQAAFVRGVAERTG